MLKKSLFPQKKNSRKIHVCLHCILISSCKCTAGTRVGGCNLQVQTLTLKPKTQFSRSFAAAMAAQVVRVGYLTQGEILIARNFVNTHLRRLLCMCSLSVHRNESSNMLLTLFSDLVFNYNFIFIGRVFYRCFRDPIRVPRIENRVPRIREIGSLQVHSGCLTFSLKKTDIGYLLIIA